jgi:hypothetical protein
MGRRGDEAREPAEVLDGTKEGGMKRTITPSLHSTTRAALRAKEELALEALLEWQRAHDDLLVTSPAPFWAKVQRPKLSQSSAMNWA